MEAIWRAKKLIFALEDVQGFFKASVFKITLFQKLNDSRTERPQQLSAANNVFFLRVT